MEELNLQKFLWIDMDKFEMELIEFRSSSIWKQKFIDLRVDWKTLKKGDQRREIPKRIAETAIADLECHS